MAYRASSGPGVDFLSSFREMAAHDCASYEEMWRANSRKGSHLPPVFSSAKSPLHISSLHSAFWFAVFSLMGCACICVFYPTFPIFDAKPIAAVERKGSEASLPRSKPPHCLSQAVWPWLRFPHLHIKYVSGTCLVVLGGLNERAQHLEPGLAHS